MNVERGSDAESSEAHGSISPDPRGRAGHGALMLVFGAVTLIAWREPALIAFMW